MRNSKQFLFVVIFLFILLALEYQYGFAYNLNSSSENSLLVTQSETGSGYTAAQTTAATKSDKAGFWKLVSEIIVVFFGLSIFLIGILIILENRSPARSIAWLVVLLAFPVLGFILYIFIGRKPRKRKKVRHHLQADEVLLLKTVLDNQLKMLEGPEHSIDRNIYAKKKLVNLILNNSQEPFTINNKSKVLTNGEETFSAIIEAISKAEHHIHLEYYIIQPDNIGYKIQELLIKKAREGVRVRILYDSVGSRKLNKAFLEPLKSAGVECAAFLPVKFPLFHSSINYRNHRKILIVDGKIGFVGGLNIGDDYLSKGQLGFWRDTHLQIKGEAVSFLQRIFLLDWHFATENKFVSPRYFPEHEWYGYQPIQIASSGPDSNWASIQQVYFTTITSARESIYITTPYFVPDESILMALKTAALSGIDVSIIFPAKPDKRIVYWASMSYIQEVLEAGVKVFLYEKGFVHAKILLVDGVVASVGTANMDMRSFNLNFEVNALIYDQAVVKRLENDFAADILDSRQITYEEFLNRSLWTKFKESGARLLSPML
ncbi:cardiolipin synthase [Desulfolucanica intricata]|uniref:cardiolipin synthase n=1 Tax=Desulfolucanica intricata TaxID=1285191 RepID=UPI0009ED1AFE|nr:cardiolipin synthase [Desulfolucanica intricata]